MKFTYYGQSCFGVEIKNKHILFDPFISGNPLAKYIDVQTIQADYILLSHAHNDHILDCEAIALRTGAKVICNYEIHEWLNVKGVSNTHPMNTGGSWQFEDFKVKCVVAQHSSSLPDGSYGGNAMGFIISTEEGNFYFAGDTALTLDMQLIPMWAKIDFAVLPIGNNFTMDIDDAIRAAKFVNTSKIVGVHYDTFEYIKINHQTALEKFIESNIELLLPKIGECIIL